MDLAGRCWREIGFCSAWYTVLCRVALLTLCLVGPTTVEDAPAQALPSQLPPIFDPTGRSTVPRPLEEEQPKAPPVSPFEPGAIPRQEPAPTPSLPAIQVLVRSIRVAGSTVFSESELAAVTTPYLNRFVTADEFERLRLELTMLYINRGYVTSGAVIPDQDVTAGDVTIQIVEGKLTKIDIHGNTVLRTPFYESRIARGVGVPVNIERIQERFQLLQQDPRIQRINAELKPGVQRGDSELAVNVTENRPFKAWLEFSNHQTPVVGAERGLATIQHQSLTGHGDLFSFTYGASRGVNPIIDTAYSIPLNAYETNFTATYRRNDFSVVAAPFRPLDIKSSTEIIGLTLMQPLYRTVNQQLAISLAGEYLQNRTTLLDVPFDFVQGAKNGVANVAAIRVTPEYIYRNSTSVLAVRSRFSIGIDAFDATINSGPGATARFFSWLAQLQGVHRFDQLGGMQLIGRIDVQLADKHLFPLEQMPVGGRYSVRGYRENSLVRDNGLLASLEIRIPVYRSVRGEDILQLAPFLDYGRGWNSHFDTPSPQYLASAGVGLRWNILPQDRARFEVYWGQQLNHFDMGHGNLQDHGVHVQLVGQVY
jgi:hemolysin activation/secretion protein